MEKGLAAARPFKLEKDRKSLWITLVFGLSEYLSSLLMLFEERDVNDKGAFDDFS
jgi:hypothetical protein